MDDKKIAFITCVNDEVKYAECRSYLDRLYIPKDHTIDIINVKDAPSMAAGYNAAMKDCDARYKIYLHQDVFIKNRYFLADMLKVFLADSHIGMLGMIGKKEWGTTALGVSQWDVGSVIYGYQVIGWDLPEGKEYIEVATIDGLLMATQYDIPWREDVFDGWDFYDHSQCMEFQKRAIKWWFHGKTGYGAVMTACVLIWPLILTIMRDLSRNMVDHIILLYEMRRRSFRVRPTKNMPNRSSC